MTRAMPAFDGIFDREGQRALALARAGEVVRYSAPARIRKEWPDSRLEALYELAFLRIFIAWENLLADSLYGYMAGLASANHGQAVPKMAFFKSVRAAERQVLGGLAFKLWHDPDQVKKRCDGYIDNGRHADVMDNNSDLLFRLASVRHRIAHGQPDARRKFDATTTALVGRRYRTGRPGKFLRDYNMAATPRVRWLETFVDELSTMASQIV